MIWLHCMLMGRTLPATRWPSPLVHVLMGEHPEFGSLLEAQGSSMLTDYIRAAMHQARYKILPEDGSFFGEIPGVSGVWASAPTLEECRDELEDVLEEWLALSLTRQLPIPAIGGVALVIPQAS